MTMRESPCSGYIVPVSHLRPCIPFGENLQKFDELLEDADCYAEMEEFLKQMRNENPGLWGNIPEPIGVYALTDEDTPGDEEMDRYEMFAIFDENSLYVRQPTNGLLAMKGRGIDPTFHSWSVWG